MKKIACILVAGVVMAVGLAANPAPAAANPILPAGFNLWTREYCEGGQYITFRRLHFGDQFQGREYVYLRDRRFCVFTTDHAAGSHWISVEARAYDDGWGTWGQDAGFFTEYAGALAAPRWKCVQVRSSMLYDGNHHYSTNEKQYC